MNLTFQPRTDIFGSSMAVILLQWFGGAVQDECFKFFLHKTLTTTVPKVAVRQAWHLFWIWKHKSQ